MRTRLEGRQEPRSASSGIWREETWPSERIMKYYENGILLAPAHPVRISLNSLWTTAE
jgi:hypothetical protein